MRKSCRRKRYDPDCNPVRLALFASRPTQAQDLASLRTIELMSLAALDEGRATAADRATLRRMCLVSAELGRAGIGAEALPLVERAEAALRRCGAGGAADDRLVLRELLDAYDQQRDMTSWAELDRAVHRALWGRVR
ncbi:hypothetical protein Lcho_2178 [Leptothrix cholodnii SP-6]|uniref:Uncharacterized protein n=1 Tax=Leptothrix cholodnii (strain ATCC 51168 / LMG 8142 / SP-6) TaxID=395495 RepID=B1Y2V2_LEPCP|nr:hypothetical protein [Leptothrix cholodnii]ACB34444.1 hypothetical protein Lcho_2178 [Leptothrix cholodnii SP-6]